jgi:hypothetical protein
MIASKEEAAVACSSLVAHQMKLVTLSLIVSALPAVKPLLVEQMKRVVLMLVRGGRTLHLYFVLCMVENYLAASAVAAVLLLLLLLLAMSYMASLFAFLLDWNACIIYCNRESTAWMDGS